MTEWGVVGVIVVILGLVGSVWAIADRIGKPVKDLTANVIVLTTEMKSLIRQLEKLDSTNEKEHNTMWDRIDTHDLKLAEHDTEIALLKQAKEA
jgi:hypothetical protein